MSTFFIQPPISELECIGDSLNTINTNFIQLDTNLRNLSATPFNTLETSTIQLNYNNNTRSLQGNVKNNSIDFSKLAPGMIINCINKHVITPQVYIGTNNTDVLITALDINIQPKLSTSKILIQAMINGECDSNVVFKVKRDTGTSIIDVGLPAIAGNRNVGLAPAPYDTDVSATMQNIFIQCFDQPSTTNTITYRFYFKPNVIGNNDRNFYLNRTLNDTNDTSHERAASNINIFEIK